MKIRYHAKGFTLIEVLLVLTIISAVLYMGLGYFQQKALQMRIDRTTAQMQQILNSGLSYYVANGQWPVSNGTSLNMTTNINNNLQIQGYLPAGVSIANPFGGNAYFIYTDANGRAFTVYTSISSAGSSRASSAARIIAGSLPMASTTATAGNPPPTGTPQCAPTDTTCWITASVSIPGQNLNNASAVNFTGTVRHGGCVPVPECPVDASGNTMVAEVQVVPVSVSGFYDPGSSNVYPISSFTAYAVGPATLPVQPPRCTGSTTAPACSAATVSGGVAKAYWRACLQIVTERGNVQSTPAADYGSKVLLMAITRCQINNEKSTSKTVAPTNIFSN